MITGLSPILQRYGNTKLSDNELLDSITGVAADGGYNDVVKKLVGRGIISENYPQFDSALLVVAANKGNGKLVDDLMAMQIDPDCAFMGKQALQEAISGNHCGVVEQLVIAGADPLCLFTQSYPNEDDGWPVWCTIVSEGKKELVDKILRCEHVLSKIDTCKACFGGVRKYGLTALMLAVSRGYYEITEALVIAGADVNEIEESWLNDEPDYPSDLRCCLIMALLRRECDPTGKIVELLLRKGAKIVGQVNDWSAYATAPILGLRACINKNIYDDQFFFGVNGFNDKPFSLRKLAMREVAKKVMPNDLSRLCIPEDLKYDLTTYKKDTVDDLIHTVYPDSYTS